MPDPNVGSANAHRFVIPYERGTLSPVTRWVNDGLLRYVDERKTPAFRHTSGLRLPRVNDLRQGYKRKIYTGADLFKYRASYSRKTPFGLYSALVRAVEQAPKEMDGAKRDARKLWIQANAPKLGVIADKVQWSGVLNWLDIQEGMVSAADIPAYLEQGGAGRDGCRTLALRLTRAAL